MAKGSYSTARDDRYEIQGQSTNHIRTAILDPGFEYECLDLEL